MKILKQIWATVTDKDWDADVSKIIGLVVAIVGVVIIIVSLVKWEFSNATTGMGMVAAGLGALVARSITDK